MIRAQHNAYIQYNTLLVAQKQYSAQVLHVIIDMPQDVCRPLDYFGTSLFVL